MMMIYTNLQIITSLFHIKQAVLNSGLPRALKIGTKGLIVKWSSLTC